MLNCKTYYKEFIQCKNKVLFVICVQKCIYYLFIYTSFYVDIYNKSIKHSDLYNSLYTSSYKWHSTNRYVC